MRFRGNDELAWLASRYVLGEMTAGEEERFERRLADDQEAREAVEQAVELNEAVRLVGATPRPARVRRASAWSPFRKPAVLAAGLAASLYIALGLFWGAWPPHAVGPTDSGSSVKVNDPSDEETAVARAWADLRKRQQIEPIPPHAEEPEFAPDEVETEMNVRPWMLAAFSDPDDQD